MLCLLPPSLLLLLLLPLLYYKLVRTLGPSSNANSKLPLPPGSMGWPYIGETFRLYSKNPNTFFAQKQKRYGSVFKTRILGCPSVMVSSPEAAKFILATKAHLFRPTFPASKERMIGRQAIFFQEGKYHSKLRKLVLRAFMPEGIMNKVTNIEALAVETLRSWEDRQINTYREMKTYAFNVALLSIFGKEELHCIEELKKRYYILEEGYNSLPINLPGTLFHKAMTARRQLGQIVINILSTRKSKGATSSNDLLTSFMEDSSLTDAQIADNIIGVIFAARDTTASVLTWILKYLGENPTFLRAVTDEQEAIMREKGDRNLSWEDARKMVIQETMRIASIISFTFREAVEDVEYEGYLIPKGWKVMPLFRNIHHSPDNFQNPHKFDPTRFEVGSNPKTFMPFGKGHHCCPGNELAKLEMLVMLHHLTTKYRWVLPESDGGIHFGPFVLPADGLPVGFSRKGV